MANMKTAKEATSTANWKVRRVCIHWPRFGPLHLNRIGAAHALLARHGIETVALEVATDDAIYDWREERGATPYHRETLFPGRSYDDLTPAQMHRAVTKALDRLDPDAVNIHSYSTPDARACIAWCRRHHRVAVCIADSKENDAARIAWREALKRLIVSQFDAAQSAGSAAARYHALLGIPGERIFSGSCVVHNNYFAERAAHVRNDPTPARALPGLGEATPFFLASSRFIERKDLPTLLRAYGAYRRRSAEPWRLVLVGDGPLRPRLEGLVSQERIAGVTFGGWQQIEALPAYYGLASAFVHTATVDQWALVVNEAMAAGLPVIVSAGSGCAEDLVREGENGFTFAPGDEEGLAHRMHAVAHEVDLDAFARRSHEIIAEWPLERFGTSLLQAVEAGAEPARRRPFDPRARLLISVLRLAARSPRSFHTVES